MRAQSSGCCTDGGRGATEKGADAIDHVGAVRDDAEGTPAGRNTEGHEDGLELGPGDTLAVARKGA